MKSLDRSEIEGRVILDSRAQRVYLNGQELVLGPRMFGMLVALVERPDCVFHVDHLAAKVWGDSLGGVSTHAIYLTLSKLRRRLPLGAIRTFSGRGYAYISNPEDRKRWRGVERERGE